MTPAAVNVPSLEERYTRTEGRIHLTGLQALIRISLDQVRRDRAAGLRVGAFYSGYPGSPLAGLDLTLSRLRGLLDAEDIRLIPGLNEEIAAASVCGTQVLDRFPHSNYDGVLGIWFGKAPGLDRALDVIRHSNFTGISRYGGAVALVGDDPQCKSSSLPSHSELALAHAYVPTFYPSDAAEVVELGRLAFALSRYAGLWTAMKIVSDVADGGTVFDIGAARSEVVLPSFEVDGRPFSKRLETTLLAPYVNRVEEEILYQRLEATRRFAYENRIDAIEGGRATDRVGVVAAGRLYRELVSAFERLGLDAAKRARAGIRLLNVRMLYPLDERRVREFAEGLEEIIVVDDRRGFLESQLRAALYAAASRPRILGQYDERGRPWLARRIEPRAELLAADLMQHWSTRFAGAEWIARAEYWAELERSGGPPLRIPRKPHFCSGCPHTQSTRVPDGSLAGGGIGCHTLAALQPDKVEFFNAMGSEGAQWIGLSHYTDVDHLFQNVGDGTYFHSGRLSLRACVEAGVNITYRILYNGVIAMTGGQTPVGVKSAPQLVEELLGEGVSRVVAISGDPALQRMAEREPRLEVRPREDYDAALEQLRQHRGVSVVLFDQVCSNQKARLEKRGVISSRSDRIFINQDVCEGCGDCGRRSECASLWPVPTALGRKTQVHQTSCTDDRSCIAGECPAFMSVESGPARRGPLPYDPLELPPPPLAELGNGRFEILTVGIGSTGVVTLNAILLRAAEYDGLHALHLDQTGLAQRGGRVTSHCILGREPIAGSARVGWQRADVCFALDPLSASEADSLRCLDIERTHTLALASVAPTAQEVRDASLSSDPAASLCEHLERRSLSFFELHANEVVESLLGSSRAANVALLGAALQLGRLPLRLASLQSTIRDSGIAVEENLAALELGRAVAHDPSLLERLIESSGPPSIGDHGSPETARALLGTSFTALEAALSDSPAGPEHESWLERTAAFATDLVAYQDRAYAEAYLERLTRIVRAETSIKPGSLRLSTQVARELYRLMAYKDEYEVARLLVSGPYRRWLEARSERPPKLNYYLEPPLLRLFGLRRKLRIGRLGEPALRALAACRFLRGSIADPFRWLASRRLERDLVTWFSGLIDQIAASLTPANLDRSIELTARISEIRGFEDVKAERARVVREDIEPELRELLG